MDYYSKINYMNQYMISKSDVMDSLRNYIVHCEETQEEGWSENKRKVILEILKKFSRCVEELRFPEIESVDWFYQYMWKGDGIVLELQHCDKAEFDEEQGLVSMESSNSMVLAQVKCAYLTVEQYAEKYDVTVTAVRQWIRRGKLRSAVKMGRDWLIPELADRPQRGYEPVTYSWQYLSDALLEEYPFLDQCCELHIMRSERERAMFQAVLLNKYGKVYEKLRMGIKEREKLELALISQPEVEAEEWQQSLMFVPNKEKIYYLKGGKIMLEEEVRKYEDTIKMMRENNLEIHTSNDLYDEDGMYIWGFSASMSSVDYDEEGNETGEAEAVRLDGGIVIPSESEFMMEMEENGYTSAAELCDSMSGDMISTYITVANMREGIKPEILKELDLPEEAAYESSILYIQNIEEEHLENLKMFLKAFDFVKEGIPASNCSLAVCLMSWEQESEKAKIFLECGWRIRSIDQSAVLVYRRL